VKIGSESRGGWGGGSRPGGSGSNGKGCFPGSKVKVFHLPRIPMAAEGDIDESCGYLVTEQISKALKGIASLWKS